jgi:hypothetical protein
MPLPWRVCTMVWQGYAKWCARRMTLYRACHSFTSPQSSCWDKSQVWSQTHPSGNHLSASSLSSSHSVSTICTQLSPCIHLSLTFASTLPVLRTHMHTHSPLMTTFTEGVSKWSGESMRLPGECPLRWQRSHQCQARVFVRFCWSPLR